MEELDSVPVHLKAVIGSRRNVPFGSSAVLIADPGSDAAYSPSKHLDLDPLLDSIHAALPPFKEPQEQNITAECCSFYFLGLVFFSAGLKRCKFSYNKTSMV